jgi:hypothetical protein
MAKLLIDFQLGAASVSNPDGSFTTNFTGSAVVNGPGNTSIGNFPNALDLGLTGKAICNISSLVPNLKQFCINVLFNATGPVNARQNLVESNMLPFAIFLTKGSTANNFNLVTSVKPKNHNWVGPDTLFKNTLSINKWYTVSLVYDFDTAALFIDGKLISVHAFPQGNIDQQPGKQLFFGTWVDGSRDHFNGKLAAFQWYSEIPEELEKLLDERRNHAEWFITHKSESFKKNFNIGERTKGISYSSQTGAHTQEYSKAAIMFHHSVGVAFEMHGLIYERFKSMTNSASLGLLVCDESNTTRAGGKKSLFSKGGIYWSPGTGAHPVLGNIYAEYENQGESKTWGFPIKASKTIPNGIEQEFQGCRFYYRNGAASAHEVHGSILAKLLASGGVNKWGFPVTNESDVLKGSTVIGKYSEFETCTFFWSGATGAFEVHGDIRRKYMEMGGPLCDLGFPTSDEVDIPNNSGAGKANTFQKGSILWFGNFNTIKVARPYKIYIGRIDSKEQEGFGRGQNDLYIKKIKVTEGTTVLYEARRPSSGSWDGKNIVDVNFMIPKVITPNKLNVKVKFYLDIWEDDSPTDSDDHMGTYEKVLEASNAWGLLDNEGIYNVAFKHIRSLTWSVKPEVNINSLTQLERWWGVQNRGTATITYPQYASAFKGVDSDTEWWDVTDWIEKAFYEAVVKGIAKGGNCFGMSLENIYARKNRSLFGMPVNRFTDWNTTCNEFNIKQQYQVGANPIWWFLGQFLSGNTHDPVDVFNFTHQDFLRGNNPVLCVAQNYDFSGKPHCILPVAWNKSSKPWKMTICDPNFPTELKELTVNPDNNTFRYQGSALYTGGEWSGGRMHYMPFSILCEKQRMPVWDLLLLLLSGTILILADDGETTSITDSSGQDLNAFGSRATNLMKNGNEPSEFFVGFNGFDSSLKPGQIFIRKETSVQPMVTAGISTALNLPLTTRSATNRITSLSEAVGRNQIANQVIEGRSAQHILNDPGSLAKLNPSVIAELQKVANVNSKRNFIHSVKGVKTGKLSYLVKSGLNVVRIETPINANESHKLEVNDLGTNFCTMKMNSARAKNLTFEVHNQLGVNGDFSTIKIQDFPISPSNNLEINIKQGIGGVELANKGPKLDLNISYTTKINKVVSTNNFVVPVEKGVRLMPASILTEKELTVSSIDRVFGSGIKTFRIKL